MWLLSFTVDALFFAKTQIKLGIFTELLPFLARNHDCRQFGAKKGRIHPNEFYLLQAIIPTYNHPLLRQRKSIKRIKLTID